MFGIDTSHHQGVIHFSEVAKNDPKVDFIFMKASQGVGYRDPNTKHNSFEAQKAGIKVGFYHYATMPTKDVTIDATAEANHFIDTIQSCAKPDLPLVLDIEENKSNLSRDQIELWIHTFFTAIELRGYSDYILYSYTPFLDANLPKYHKLGGVRLWIAAYITKPQPKLPKGWESYYIWQYSAKGKVKGISSDCDLNKSVNPIFS